MSFAVWLSRDVAGENLVDALLILQLLPPHFQQCVFGRLALQVEEVVVVELAEGRRRGVSPASSSGSVTSLGQTRTRHPRA